MSETNQMLFRRVRQAEQERDEMRRRLEAAERVVEAARRSGPYPRISYSQHQYGIGPRYTCQHCYAHAPNRESLRHVQRCPGEQMEHALAAYDAATESEARP